MKDSWMDAKGERMLELLAEGAPSRIIARQMGYQEGTMRVYLHKLYKRIGVANKTEAVIWYLSRGKVGELCGPRGVRACGSNDLLGEMAIHEDLFTALGVMSEFLGPYGRMWEVATKLSGEEIDPRTHERRERSRLLWRALLRGDGVYGKRIYDADMGAKLLVESPVDAVHLVALLAIGGFSGAADDLAARLAQKKKGAAAREAALVKSLREAVEGGDAAALAALGKASGERGANPGFRQAAMVLLFHAYRLRKDFPRARQTANALWAEAEAARRELEAMGDRPLAHDMAIPLPEKAPARLSASREKVAARQP